MVAGFQVKLAWFAFGKLPFIHGKSLFIPW